MEGNNISNKSRLVATLLSFFLGTLGIHRFYVGKVGTGVLMLLFTLSILGLIVSSLWALVDFIMIVCGQFKDKEKRIISEW